MSVKYFGERFQFENITKGSLQIIKRFQILEAVKIETTLIKQNLTYISPKNMGS